MKTFLVIPDMHIPFQHRDSFEFLKLVEQTYYTNETVCVGDLVDSYTLSQFEKDPDMPGARMELVKAKKVLAELYKLFPKVKMCLGNHDLRYLRTALKAGIPRDFIVSLEDVLNSPVGWEWEMHHDIEGIRFMHGVKTGANAAMAHAMVNGMCTVIGHTHAHAGTSFLAGPTGRLLWALNVGCLVNKKSLAFAYAKDLLNKPTLGCGVIQDGIPMFIPMFLNKKGRWIGRV
jgi:predicted phosphodiesterase